MNFSNTNTLKFSAAISLLLFASSCNNKPDDKEMKESVTKQLQSNPIYKGITADVNNGVVTLSGTCEGSDCAMQAQNNVKEVRGVDSIKNDVQTKGTDFTLRTSVQTVISKYQGVQADVAEGVVVLRGSIDKAMLQPLMTELQALQPKKIDNQLAVK